MPQTPQITLLHTHGSDEWEVQLDCGKTIKLKTPELTHYRRFRMQALAQAQRLFPPMRDEDWLPILAEAMEVAKIDADLLSCSMRYRR